jgi:hypothetical protein
VAAILPHLTRGKIMETRKDTFTFSKCLFNCTVNDRGVDKYESESGKIKLIVTNIKKGDTDKSVTFNNDDEYQQWLDRIVSDEDYTYNKARALACVLTQLDDEFDFNL